MKKGFCLVLFLFCYLPSAVLLSAQNFIRLPDILLENSGLVNLGNDSLAWIGDSQNPSEIYTTNPSGKLLGQIQLDCKNIDWEAITIDRENGIIIGDIGDNAGIRKERQIYYLDSIAKFYGKAAKDPKVFTIVMNESEKFPDFEAMISLYDHLFLFSKASMSATNKICYIYKTGLTDRVNRVQIIDSIHLDDFIVTDAAVNTDKNILALLSYRYKFLFGKIPDSDARIYFFRLAEFTHPTFDLIGYYTIPTWFGARQYESVCFDKNGDILVAAEGNKVLKPILRRIKSKKVSLKWKK